jgi:transketolase
MPETQVMDLQALKEKARSLRLDILDMTTRAGSGHPSSSFSAVEIATALFFGGILRYRSHEPHWPARDRFIMSKGHAAPLLYAVLAHAGYFDREELWRLRQIDSPVQGHPIQDMMPGVEATTGSLGQGLSIGLGHVLGGRLNKLDYRVYVVLGDGECQAGQTWEAALNLASIWKLPVVYVCENNQYAMSMSVTRAFAIKQLSVRAVSYNIPGVTVDGNDLIEVYNAVREAAERARAGHGPSLIESATYRWRGHSKSDRQRYRTREEVKEWQARDPIGRLRDRLVEAGLFSREELDQVDEQARQAIEDAVAFAEAATDPDPTSVMDGVYA